MDIRWNKICILAFRALLLTIALFLAQVSKSQQIKGSVYDTLKLEDVIEDVIQNNPVIKESGELITMSELSVKLAQSAWLPMINGSASYSRMAPIPSFDIPQFGHIQLYPNNNVNLEVDARQLIYDFGKTGKNVQFQEINQEMAKLTVEQVKEKYALASAGIFYSLYYIQNAKDIVRDHQNTLKKHLELVENKQMTGSATQYEILSTRVNLSAAKTQLSELQTAYDVQLLNLATIMGTKLENPILYADTSLINNLKLEDSSFTFASAHREDLLLLDRRQTSAYLNYKLIKAQTNPVLGFFGNGGYKNGYLPHIENPLANYMAGVSLQFPIFNANRKKINLEMASSSISQLKYESENTQRTAHDDITTSYLQLKLSGEKVNQSKIQVQQAQEAYNHAEINFKEGFLTNLDLLYASDILAESQLQLLRNKMDYITNLLKYKDSLGENIY